MYDARIGKQDDSWLNEFEGRYSGRRVLITGASGFVGSHLIDALLFLGADVYGASLISTTSSTDDRINSIDVDLNNPQDVKHLIEHTKPEYVFHMAGLVNTCQDIDYVLPTFQNNLFVSLNLMLALANYQCQRIIITGSSETPLHGEIPNSPYAASKLAVTFYAEMFQMLYHQPIVVARPFMSYGPGQSSDKLIPYIINSYLQKRQPLLTSGNRICDLIYIKDIVRGLLTIGLCDESIGESVDFGSAINISIRDIALRIAKLMGSECLPKFGAIPDRVSEHCQIANIEKTKMAIGWVPRWTLDEGLLETITWYKQGFKS
jgi:UDP-glucose 4-epimerase